MGLGTIWDKIDPDVIERPVVAETDASASSTGAAEKESKWRRRVRIGDAIGSLFWVWALTKLFIIDFDRVLVERFAPFFTFVLDFRFFFFMALLAIVIAVVRKSALWILYVMLFPLIVLLWKIPRLLYKIRSWNLLLAAGNAAHAFVVNFKRNFVVRIIEALSLVLAVVFEASLVLIPCLFVITVGLLFHFYRAAITAIRTSRFLTTQQQLITSFVQSEGVRDAALVKPELRSDEVAIFDKDQVQLFVNSVSTGVLIWRILDIYTFLLGKYRRSAAPFVLGIASFLWIFLQSVVALTFINLIIWKLDPSQYAGPPPSFIDLAYYSVSSIYANTIPQVAPAGDVATTINFLAAIYGPVLLLTFTVQLWLGLKQARDESSFTEIVNEVKKNRVELERRLEADYEVTLEEALRRLDELRVGVGPLLTYIAARLPLQEDPQRGLGG